MIEILSHLVERAIKDGRGTDLVTPTLLPNVHLTPMVDKKNKITNERNNEKNREKRNEECRRR